MKMTLTTLLFFMLILVGCMDNSVDLNSPDAQINQELNSPNWVKLPGDLGQDLGVETAYTASKMIKGDKGGHIKLKVRLHQHGNPLGNHFEVKVKVKVEKHAFPDDEERLFTITMDPEYAYLKISPSPNTLYKHVTIDWEIKGIDVSGFDPNTFDFFYIGDNNEMLETSKKKLKIDFNRNKIQLKKGIIYPTATENTPPGVRYIFTK